MRTLLFDIEQWIDFHQGIVILLVVALIAALVTFLVIRAQNKKASKD